MMVDEERRATGAQRVPVQTLVEMCGRDITGAPTFEAEAINVSGRGMHVRTAYLPEVGSDLVCRLEDRGREIIAEGVVVWRNPEARGGEFGLMFTALDSGSVAALNQLCENEAALPELGAKPIEKPAPESAESRNDPGSRVRLHIDGLGAPMKALVREAATKKLKVGSNLEFLKVGRHLEIESLDQSSRRGAYIDGIDVLVDPQSGVPQLVVALHYDDLGDTTPEPIVVDRGETSAHQVTDPLAAQRAIDRAPARAHGTVECAAADVQGPVDRAPADVQSLGAEPLNASLRQAPRHHDLAQCDAFNPATEGDAEPFEALNPGEELPDGDNMLRSRVGQAAANAGRAAKQGSEVLARLGVRAAGGVGRFFKGAGAKALEFGRKARENKRSLRTTAAPPNGGSAEPRRLRPQSAAARAPTPETSTGLGQAKPGQIRRIAAGAALLVLVVAVGVLAMHRPAPPPGSAATQPSAAFSVAAADVKEVDAQGNPVTNAKVQRLTAPAPASSQGQAQGLTAEVPLFGPTPMATMEPAPLGPTPDSSAQGAVAPATAPGAMPGSAPAIAPGTTPGAAAVAPRLSATDQGADSPPPIADEAFDDQSKDRDSKDGKAKEKRSPTEVKPWGKGTVKTPTIHRLRLDAPGTAIKGEISSSGFAVFLPGRKVMEAPGGIAKRDKRIVQVSSQNTGAGARVSFKFRDGVPGYRVRLRKDFVEFLISAPAK